MAVTVEIAVRCDHPNCPAFRLTREPAASAATQRLNGIDDGWSYFEGDDYCPTHRPKRRAR